MRIGWVGFVAAAIAAYGAGLYYEQTFAPAGCCALTWPTPDPVQAERILVQTDAKNVNPAAQMKAAVAVISARPGDPTGWLRLSYGDWLSHNGRMTDLGRRALDTSYLITPYGGHFAPWRIWLSLNNWSILPMATRMEVLGEIAVIKQEPARMAALRKADSVIVDPGGRLSAAVLGIGPTGPAQGAR